MILLEGFDGVGKTTLAELISVKTKRKVQHLHFKPTETLSSYVPLLLQHVTRNMLYDRMHLSQAVYPVLFPDSGRLPMLPWHQAMIEARLQQIGTVQVFVDRPLEDTQKALTARGEDYVRLDQVEEGLRLYSFAVKRSALPTHLYVTGTMLKPKTDNFIASVLAAEARIVKKAKVHAEKYGGLGNHTSPDYVVVGNLHEKNIWPGNSAYAPFFSCTGTNFMLHKYLHLAGIRNCYFTYSVKFRESQQDLELLRAELAQWPNAVVIGYGPEACRRLVLLGITHRMVPTVQTAIDSGYDNEQYVKYLNGALTL